MCSRRRSPTRQETRERHACHARSDSASARREGLRSEAQLSKCLDQRLLFVVQSKLFELWFAFAHAEAKRLSHALVKSPQANSVNGGCIGRNWNFHAEETAVMAASCDFELLRVFPCFSWGPDCEEHWQSRPKEETPGALRPPDARGLAIKDYWKPDARTAPWCGGAWG